MSRDCSLEERREIEANGGRFAKPIAGSAKADEVKAAAAEARRDDSADFYARVQGQSLMEALERLGTVSQKRFDEVGDNHVYASMFLALRDVAGALLATTNATTSADHKQPERAEQSTEGKPAELFTPGEVELLKQIADAGEDGVPAGTLICKATKATLADRGLVTPKYGKDFKLTAAGRRMCARMGLLPWSHVETPEESSRYDERNGWTGQENWENETWPPIFHGWEFAGFAHTDASLPRDLYGLSGDPDVQIYDAHPLEDRPLDQRIGYCHARGPLYRRIGEPK